MVGSCLPLRPHFSPLEVILLLRDVVNCEECIIVEDESSQFVTISWTWASGSWHDTHPSWHDVSHGYIVAQCHLSWHDIGHIFFKLISIPSWHDAGHRGTMGKENAKAHSLPKQESSSSRSSTVQPRFLIGVQHAPSRLFIGLFSVICEFD
ncbi:hypothetical protein QL285_074729 [Trifolium repens]|nr:hypothetical protein QL285_074729 [Trifolium repens]